MISGGVNGGFLFWFPLFIFSILSAALAGGFIPILLGAVGILGWWQGFKDFLELGETLSQIDDPNEADKLFNKEMMDTILPMVFTFILGHTIKGLGQTEHEEDLFMLVINDILLTYFYGMFDSN